MRKSVLCQLVKGKELDYPVIDEIKFLEKIDLLNSNREGLGHKGIESLITEEKSRCGSCAHFKRLKWHESVVKGGGYQLGGLCPVLQMVLQGENSYILNNDNGIYVMQSFGCIYWKQK